MDTQDFLPRIESFRLREIEYRFCHSISRSHINILYCRDISDEIGELESRALDDSFRYRLTCQRILVLFYSMILGSGEIQNERVIDIVDEIEKLSIELLSRVHGKEGGDLPNTVWWHIALSISYALSGEYTKADRFCTMAEERIRIVDWLST